MTTPSHRPGYGGSPIPAISCPQAGCHSIKTVDDLNFLVACLEHWSGTARWINGAQLPHVKLTRFEFDIRNQRVFPNPTSYNHSSPQWSNIAPFTNGEYFGHHQQPSGYPHTPHNDPYQPLSNPGFQYPQEHAVQPHLGSNFGAVCYCPGAPYAHVHMAEDSSQAIDEEWHPYQAAAKFISHPRSMAPEFVPGQPWRY